MLISRAINATKIKNKITSRLWNFIHITFNLNSINLNESLKRKIDVNI